MWRDEHALVHDGWILTTFQLPIMGHGHQKEQCEK